MINIDKFRTFFYNVANKSGRGTITPSQFNSFIEQGLQSYYNGLVGLTDTNGVPLMKLDANQENIDSLSPLKESVPLLSSLGNVLYPDGVSYDLNGNKTSEFWTFGSLGYTFFDTDRKGVKTVVERPISIVKENDWNKALSSTIIAPTMKRPIARFLGDKIEVRPKSIGSVILTYYRFPKTPKWGYTTINGRPVYDSTTSVDIEATNDAFNKLAMICLGYLGINLREQDLFQYANATENK